MVSELSFSYRLLMWLLLPLTLGTGTLVLWARARRWPARVDADGIMLRSGRTIAWTDIQHLGVLKETNALGKSRVLRLDIHHAGKVVRVRPSALKDGDDIASNIRRRFDESRSRKPDTSEPGQDTLDLPDPVEPTAKIG